MNGDDPQVGSLAERTRTRSSSASTTRASPAPRSSTPPTPSTASAAGRPTNTAPSTSATSATTTARTAATRGRRSTSPPGRSSCTASSARRSISSRRRATQRVELALPGLYNVYNALGAAALAQALGASLDEIAAGLARFSAAFGRFERIPVDGKQLLLLLIKNPAGANEVVRTLVDGGPPRVAVVALNDGIADGRDVSWIWDVDFEPLLEGLETVVVTGERAAELALRFKYGGFDESRIVVEPSLEAAIDRGLSLTPDAGELVVLPTYTAMLALQRLVAERGLAKPYWERAA